MLPPISPPLAPSEWRRIYLLTALIVLLACLPYLAAYAAPTGQVFAGILINPADGQSYLAKMREGWRGAWLFTLPYTADPGPGAFIFIYYLALGHLARLTGLSLDAVYHLARLAAGAFLLVSAYHFIAHFFQSARVRLGVWLLYALGSGLGWLAAPLGAFTSDLWVAEAFPFLSIFANSHFCLAAGLMLWILEWTLPAAVPPSRRLAGTALAVTALAQVQPMVLVTPGVVLGTLTLIQAIRAWRAGRLAVGRLWAWPGLWPLLVLAACGGPWVLYDLWASNALPQLAGWNAQNLTLSPPLWEAALSGGVPLALALAGAVAWLRRRAPQATVAVAWLGLNIALIYAPLALQRRLSLGIWMPVAILAGVGWQTVVGTWLAPRWRRLGLAALVMLIAPSNLLVYAATLSAVPRRAPELFLTPAEAGALGWLEANASGQVVVASPGLSLFIPARTDARVVYGHPFETVAATAHKEAVEDFYAGRLAPERFFAAYPAAYVVYGPRERALGHGSVPAGWRMVYPLQGEGEVTIYGR